MLGGLPDIKNLCGSKGGVEKALPYIILICTFLQLGQALKHPVAASAKPCRAELPRGSSRTDQAERGTQSSAGSRASAQRGWRNLFSDHKHLQDAQTISLPHWNEQIIFGGFSCPPAPQNSNSSRVWGCWG